MRREIDALPIDPDTQALGPVVRRANNARHYSSAAIGGPDLAVIGSLAHDDVDDAAVGERKRNRGAARTQLALHDEVVRFDVEDAGIGAAGIDVCVDFQHVVARPQRDSRGAQQIRPAAGLRRGAKLHSLAGSVRDLGGLVVALEIDAVAIDPDAQVLALRTRRPGRSDLKYRRALLLAWQRRGPLRRLDRQEPLFRSARDKKPTIPVLADRRVGAFHQLRRIRQGAAPEVEVLIGPTETPVRRRQRQQRINWKIRTPLPTKSSRNAGTSARECRVITIDAFRFPCQSRSARTCWMLRTTRSNVPGFDPIAI